MVRGGKRLQILPDGERVEEALLAAAAREPLVDARDYLTFAQLCEQTEGLRKMGRRPIAPVTARVLLSGCARSLPRGPFGAFVQEPAFARAALQLCSDLKVGGMTPAQFESAVEHLPVARRARAGYLAQLYRAYEARLAELSLADREDALRFAVWALREHGLPRAFARYATIELRAMYDFPPLRLELLVALAERCKEREITLRLVLPAAGNPHVDAAVDPVLSLLEKRFSDASHVELEKEDAVAEERPFGAVGSQLFSPAAREKNAPELCERLEIFSAGTAREEALQLAKRVRRAIAEGVPPEQIAVCYRDLRAEAEWLLEALEELGIPARIRQGAPLLSTTAGRIAAELPLLVDDGYPAEEVSRLLGSRYLHALGESAIDAPEKLFKLAAVRDNRLGASGDQGAYQRRLSRLAERLDRQGQKVVAWQVRELWSRVQQLFVRCDKVPSDGKAGVLLERWWSAVEALGILEAMRRSAPRALEQSAYGRAVVRSLARDQAASEALLAMVSELQLAFKQSGHATTIFSRRAFQRWLSDAAQDFNLPPRGHRSGAVWVLDVRAIAGRAFSRVFVGGLCDGRFPSRPEPQLLFSSDDRAQVNRCAGREVFRGATGEGEGFASWQLVEDRLLFHLALCAATDRVVLSHPRRAEDGREQVRSPFLTELQRLTGAQVTELPLRPVPTLSELEVEEELRQRAAMEAFARPSLRASESERVRTAIAQAFGGEPWFEEARALTSIEEERLSFFTREDAGPGAFSGRVEDPRLQGALAEIFRSTPERPLSASSLGKFGNCAFQGFLAHALRLPEPEAFGEDLDARGQGSFWHKVLELLVPRLHREGLLGKPASAIPDLILEEALSEAATWAEQTGHVGHPALWQVGKLRALAMVRRILNDETHGLPFESHLPRDVELVFGRPEAPEGWKQVTLPGEEGEDPIHLAGKIDRLDAQGNKVGVIDYKSGRLDGASLRRALLTTQFQLPLYLYAAKQAGAGELRAAWMSLRTGEVFELAPLLEKEGVTLEHLLSTEPGRRAQLAAAGAQNFANAVHRLVGSLKQGHFPIRPEDCGHCHYRAVCRISARTFEEGPDGRG